tara:strand:- start:632 stop:1012 length:381 start_codon:yes stop_codon:yes gene_type:complete
MIILLEMTISLLLLMSIEKIGELYGDSFLEIHLNNGHVLDIKIDKDRSYACPINCGAIHHHSVILDKNPNSSKYTINYLDADNRLKINNCEISNIYEINKRAKESKKTKKLKTKVDLQAFVKRYNL